MKNVSILLTLVMMLGNALAQGVIHLPGVVSFQNTETARPPGTPETFHLIYNGLLGTPLVGTQFKAELYYMDTDLNSLIPVPASISLFKGSTTSVPGTWQGPSASVGLPHTYNGGGTLGGVDIFDNGSGEIGDGSGTGMGYYPVGLCVKVWDSTFGATFETANGGFRLQSSVFAYTQRSTGLITDVQMINQRGAVCLSCPEPSSIALSALGIAALLLFVRRNGLRCGQMRRT